MDLLFRKQRFIYFILFCFLIFFSLLRWIVKAWVAWQVLILLVLFQGFAPNSIPDKLGMKWETVQKVASGSLCSPNSMVLGQSELLSVRSLEDTERSVGELLITLRVETEDEGPGEASRVTGLIPWDRSTDSTCEKYPKNFLHSASPVQEQFNQSWHTHTGFCTAAFKMFFSDGSHRLNHGVVCWLETSYSVL